MTLPFLDAELSALDSFLESHRAIGGESSGAVENSMIKSWIAKMGSVALDATALAQLNTKIAAMRFISPASKTELGTALGVAAIAASSGACPFDVNHQSQYMSHPQNYPEADVWDVVSSPDTSLHSKTQAMADCYVSKGLIHPNEKTVKTIAALLASSHWHSGSPTGAARHDLVLNLKQWFKAQRVGREPTPYIRVFPVEPTHLSNYAQLYDVDKPPKSCTPIGFMREHAQMVMRSTNKQVRSSTGIHQPGQSVNHLHAAAPQGNPLEILATFMTQMISGNAPGRDDSPLHLKFNRREPHHNALPRLGRGNSLSSGSDLDAPSEAAIVVAPCLPSSAPPAGPPPAPLPDDPPPPPAFPPVPTTDPKHAVGVLEYGASIEKAMAARAAAGAGALLKKKPAAKTSATAHVKKADTAKGVAKHSAKAHAKKDDKVGRPPVMRTRGTTYYNAGKVHFSEIKQGYRVFKKAGDRVDKVFKWQPTMAAGWKRALDYIDGI